MSHERLKQQFTQAHNDYSDALFRHCFFRIRDRERAKELVQETFIKSWVYAASGNTIKNMKAFLYKVANNLIINETQRRKPITSLDTLIEETHFEPADEQEYSAGQNVDIEKLLRLVDTLDETYRTVIVLRYIDSLAVKEIAEVMDLTESNVSVRIHRALKQLRERFDT